MGINNTKWHLFKYISFFFLTMYSVSQADPEAIRDTFAGVPVVVQAPSERWCWAAAAKSLCHYYNKNFNLSLVEVAKVYTTDQNKFPPATQLPDVLKKIVEPNCPNVTTEFKKGVISIEDVKKMVDEKKPFLYVMQWTASGYHCVVISGYKGTYNGTSSSNFQVYAMDPGKTTKQWILYTAKGLNMGQGCIGNFIVTSQSTDISKETKHSSNDLSFTLLTDKRDIGMVQYSINGVEKGTINITIFDLKGTCMYQTQKTVALQQSVFSMPFPWSSGRYFAVCEMANTRNPGKIHSFFTILK